jgi:hypothetical protein
MFRRHVPASLGIWRRPVKPIFQFLDICEKTPTFGRRWLWLLKCTTTEVMTLVGTPCSSYFRGFRPPCKLSTKLPMGQQLTPWWEMPWDTLGSTNDSRSQICWSITISLRVTHSLIHQAFSLRPQYLRSRNPIWFSFISRYFRVGHASKST